MPGVTGRVGRTVGLGVGVVVGRGGLVAVGPAWDVDVGPGGGVRVNWVGGTPPDRRRVRRAAAPWCRAPGAAASGPAPARHAGWGCSRPIRTT